MLFTLDTTRADHIGCYGHQGIETPHIDALAASGLRFDNAFTPVPVTLPAHTSILTGTFPVYHGVRSNHGFYVPERSSTLAEILRKEGYSTAAFVGAFPLDSQTGLDQGFDLYDDNYPSSLEREHPQLRRFFDERPAVEVNRAALAWLDHEERTHDPFFLWVHYFDPHQPLSPPSPFRERFSNPYDAEIASVDNAIGQILDRLRTTGRLENTLIVLTADHGEGLGEHGEASHALLLYSSTVRVPLIVQDPRTPDPQTIRAPVSTVDIFPTVLDRLGLEIPPETQGIVLPSSEASATPDRAIYSETLYGRLLYGWSPIERLTTPDWTLIRGPQSELFDRAGDGRETDDLSREQGRRVELLIERTARIKSRLSHQGEPLSQANVDDESAARLAALGYLGGGREPLKTDDIDASRLDPRLAMNVFNLDMEAGALIDAGLFDLALPLLRRAVALDPENPRVLRAMAQAHLGLGDLATAEPILQTLLRIDPEDLPTHLLLASLFRSRGELETALDSLLRAAQLEPADHSTRLLLAHHYEDAGDLESAESAYRTILEESDGRHVMAVNGLATLVYQRGDEAGAILLLESGLAAQPYFAPALLNLGVIEHNRGNYQRSVQLAERALALRPGYPNAARLRQRSLDALQD